MLFHHFRMAEDSAQDIVEVMGDTTGERAYRLHATGLLQAHLQPCSLSFKRLPPNGISNGIESHAQETEFAGCRNGTRPADRVKTQGHAGTVFVDMRHARPPTQADGNASVSVFSWRHAIDAWNVALRPTSWLFVLAPFVPRSW